MIDINKRKIKITKGQFYSNNLKNRLTKPELFLKDRLDKEGLYYKEQPYFYDNDNLFIVDFRLSNNYNKIIIEVDGKNHKYQKEYDDKRTNWLQNIRQAIVIRFSNEEVLNNIEYVISKIKEYNPKTMQDILNDKIRTKENNKNYWKKQSNEVN